MLPGCPECAVSGQTAERVSGPPQVIFLENPKPYDWSRIVGSTGTKADVFLVVTGRVVSTRPLMLDPLDVNGPMRDVGSACDSLFPVPVADAKLKSVLSSLQFNQVVKARLIYGGNAEFPHELVLTELWSDAHVDQNSTACFNHSGTLLSYQGLVEYVNVYNDGSILYANPLFQRFGSEKLSREELGDLLKAFAANGFAALPSMPPSIEPTAKRYTLSLMCSRLQTVPVNGQETRLASLLAPLEELKARATSHTFYLLLVKDRMKLDMFDWPFPGVPLIQLDRERRSRVGAAGPSEAMRGRVPADFLSRLPFTFTTIGSPPDPNRNIYFTDAGKLYSVTRAPCGERRPHCDTFQDLTAWEIPEARTLLAHFPPQDPKNPSAGSILASRFGVLWPGDMSVRLPQAGEAGVRIPKSEFEKDAVYFDLFDVGSFGGGVDLIEDGYLYRGVRVCQVDPQAPPKRCMHLDDTKH